MFQGGRCSVVIGVPISGGAIVVVVTARDCCRVAVGGGAFVCTSTHCGLVTCTRKAIVGRFACPWDTNDAADDTESRRGHYWYGVGDEHVLRLVPLLS